jgi:hydrogenase maturation protein HypF
MSTDSAQPAIERHYIRIGGIVQGVGFRPFVYRQASALGLSGWVRNSPAGVEIEAQGPDPSLAAFEARLTTEAPPLAVITSLFTDVIPLADDTGFTILASGSGAADVQIAPDSALCADCLQELFDPADRRYRYPFITCTNCGPRYSIITGIPYDRPLTTMAGFPLCPDCLREYHDPSDRRFHAQPVACPACGPQVRLVPASPLPTSPRWGEEIVPLPRRGRAGEGEELVGDAAVLRAIDLLRQGAILAVKGIGGYHLAVDACNPEAVRRLRQRKKRDEKPFAVMAADLAAARRLALFDPLEERLLTGPESPIVIVRRAPDCPVAPLVAPDNGWLGLMLPYAPIHHLLFAPHPAGDMNPLSLRDRDRVRERENLTALVMTSANISDEPICCEDGEALERLNGIADFCLLHDRPIHIREDDSVIRVFQGKPLFYRRSRGYAPRGVRLPFPVPPLLAVGAELKGTVCLARGEQAVLSQHIGDLQNSRTYDSFRQTVTHLSTILEITPTVVACDLHPDYLSSLFAEEYCSAAAAPLTLHRVQHHHAHMASCMADNGLDGEVIGIVFDGTGYGSDGTIWGGEFLTGGYGGFRRVAHIRPTPLPGGDAAIREPWRMALSYLHQALDGRPFSVDHPVVRRMAEGERPLFSAMLDRGINAPLTSSCGRLFDAVAALLNIRHIMSYDGQAAIELEALAETAGYDGAPYPFLLRTVPHPHPGPRSEGEGTENSLDFKGRDGAGMGFELDFSATITALLADLERAVSTAVMARRFHATLADATVATCRHVAADSGLDRVVLSGGVFQNRLLSEMIYTALTREGMQVFTHRLTPPNDGGIALGQAAIAGRRSN